ncbi:energy transducer TonB [Azovibrio restrictus]|uniref:energy transducer TonB n=1 Tax=Azovibrio restrictus TaxID=146938 RepID=UPI0026EBC046|nr:TonB family protein [Azovibrio restrictus]MDD3483692.1 TonB family protein [Azovibrio restrictus]
MNPERPAASLALFPALGLSLILHGLLLWGLPDLEQKPENQARPALQATLAPPPVPAQPLPELELEQAPPPAAPPPPATSKPAPPPRPVPPPRKPRATPPEHAPTPLARAARQQLARLASQEGFYPLEAIAQGLEGEALVQIFLDEQGHVIAARIERSSGHALLDQAALRAARALRSLPADGLEEAVLPVRFRLE